MAATKRARTTKNELKCYVIGYSRPNSSKIDINLRTEEYVLGSFDYIYAFPAGTNPQFWELWRMDPSKMLRQEHESTPIVDLHEPLANFPIKRFVLCDWTPEHEHLRPQLDVLKYTQAIEIVDEKIEESQLEIDSYLRTKAKYVELLEKAREKLNQTTQQ